MTQKQEKPIKDEVVAERDVIIYFKHIESEKKDLVQIEGTVTAVLAGLATIIDSLVEKTGEPFERFLDSIGGALLMKRQSCDDSLEKEIERIAKLIDMPEKDLADLKTILGVKKEAEVAHE